MNTPGWTRTSDPGTRNVRRGDFAVSEETTKATFSRCQAKTSDSRSDFAWVPSFTAQRAGKAADLRNPQTRHWRTFLAQLPTARLPLGKS